MLAMREEESVYETKLFETQYPYRREVEGSSVTTSVDKLCKVLDGNRKERSLLQMALLIDNGEELRRNKHLLFPDLSVKMELNKMQTYVMISPVYEMSLHEYLKHYDWSQHITTIKKDRKTILEDIFTGVEFLFDIGVSHNDIKPANIFISPNAKLDGKTKMDVVIGDFGLARSLVDMKALMDSKRREDLDVKNLSCYVESVKQLEVSSFPVTPSIKAGTPGFASPEQFVGKVDRATDIYGLGRTLVFLLLRWDDAHRYLYDIGTDQHRPI